MFVKKTQTNNELSIGFCIKCGGADGLFINGGVNVGDRPILTVALIFFAAYDPQLSEKLLFLIGKLIG